MSLVPDFAPDAKSQWHSLQLYDQELVLDEIDRLCEHPPVKDSFVSEVIYERNGLRHFIFVRVRINTKRTHLTITGVGKCTI